MDNKLLPVLFGILILLPYASATNTTSTTTTICPSTGCTSNTLYALSMSPAGCVSPKSGNYLAGSIVTIVANALCSGIPFYSWFGSGTGNYMGTSRTANVVMNGNINENAYYEGTTTTTVCPTVGCTTTSTTSLSTTRTTTQSTTTTVCPTVGCTTTSTTSLSTTRTTTQSTTTRSTSTITTTTIPNQFYLSISGPYQCGLGPYSGYYAANSVVTLTANNICSGTGIPFIGWTGRGTGSYTGPNPIANVIMYGPINETASYEGTTTTTTTRSTTTTIPNQFYLSINGPYQCGLGPYSGYYAANSVVTLTANNICSGTGFPFMGWTGSGSGSYTGPNPMANITMYGPIKETANYEGTISISITTSTTTTIPANTFYLHVSAVLRPNCKGTEICPQWIGTLPAYCVRPANGFYGEGNTVLINATLTCNGATFVNWIGDGTGSYSGTNQSAIVTMNSNIDEIANYVSNTPITTTLKTTTATTSTTVSTTTPESTTVPSYASYTLSFSRGWNLFSVPLSYVAKTSGTCTSSDLLSPVMHLVDGRYAASRFIYGGFGYWMNTKSACSMTFLGPPLSSNEYPSLSAGWNLIGAFDQTVPFSSVSSGCSVSNGPWQYNTASGKYSATSQLAPGKGYLVKVASDCGGSTVLSGGPPPPPRLT